MNSRAKGGRTFRKAVKYALTFKGVFHIPIYQISRFAQPQPCDMIIFREGFLARLIEVRSNQYGVSKKSTIQLSQIPGINLKQIWMFKDGESVPTVRQWNEHDAWDWKDDPWEE